MTYLLASLAQVDPSKLDPDLPQLIHEASPMGAWLTAGVLIIGILLVTFKLTKRTVVKED